MIVIDGQYYYKFSLQSAVFEKLIKEPATNVEPANTAGTATIIYNTNSFCHPFDTPLMNPIINLINGTKIAGI